MLLTSNLVENFVKSSKKEGLFSHERGWKDLPLQSKNLHQNIFEKWLQYYSLSLNIPAHMALKHYFHRKSSQSNCMGQLLQPSGEKVLLENFHFKDAEI